MATLTLAPNGPGDETSIPTLVGAATHWQANLTNDGDVSYSQVDYNDANWRRNLYALEDGSDLGTITTVVVYARIRTVGITGAAKLSTKLGTFSEDYSVTAYDNYASCARDFSTSPVTGVAWTWTEVAALQAGCTLYGHGGVSYHQRCTQIWVVVTYTSYTPPTVTTQDSTRITATTATGNGTIVSLGSAAVTQHGHVWSLNADPTTADSKTENGSGSVGAFTSAITGLTEVTQYHTRAYATNVHGTSYGEDVTFTTPEAWIPQVMII